MGFLYSHTLPQALAARFRVGGLEDLVMRIKAILMRQGTAMAHTKPWKVPSAPKTHSTDMGSVSREPRAVAAEFSGAFTGAGLPRCRSPCGKVAPHNEAATLLSGEPTVTEEQLTPDDDKRRAHVWWFGQRGSLGSEAENLLICQMRNAGSRAGNTSCGSLKL